MKLSDGLYRRNGKKVYIKQPQYEELKFVSELWKDEETMKDIGGVFNFPESKWEMFYKKMISPTDGKNFYCLVYTNKDVPIGEVSFHGYDSATKIARFNVKIHSSHRNNGYGEEAVRLLLEYFFLEFGGDILMDKVLTEAGERVAQKIGFEEVRRFNNDNTMRISKEEFLNFDKCYKANIGMLMINDMDVSDFTMAKNLFEKANEILGQDIFNVYGISIDKTISIGRDIKVNIEFDNNNKTPNVLIIPGGNGVILSDKKNQIVEHVINSYNECDFMCAINEGICYLASCNKLNGVVVPKGNWIERLKNNKEYFRVVNRNYTDNGKIMLSTNLMGTLELYLNLIKKIGGNDLEEKLFAEIGLKK
ncbi:MAG: GNAT family N-acetyltransferase [Clostridium sp.]|uniref:GNAT family N-acetyltransferase n=1 Tax=Clostridium sp. TaxID=1506 RepID=UPI003F2ADA8A